MIAALERQIEESQKRLDSVQRRSKQLIQEKEETAQYWQERFQNGGSAGTAAVKIDDVVAGPYFCEPGTLAKLRTQLTSLFAEKLGSDKLPNESQWEMILCENPLACVNAGAGSGKSTTLILRVYVMRKFLRIPWRHISVFTFTKYSKWDLIEKLIKTFEKLGEEVDPLRAADVVRTFHSYACLLNNKSSGANRQIFDLIGTTSKPNPRLALKNYNVSENEVALNDLYDIENPMAEPIGDYKEERGEAQRITVNTKLKEIYHVAFKESEHFRDCIKELRLASLSLKAPNISPDYQAKIEFVKNKDEQLTKYLNESFGGIGSFGDVLDMNIEKMSIDGTQNGLQCYFNARIKTTKRPILFMPSEKDREVKLPNSDYQIGHILTAKLRMLWLESHVIPITVNKDELAALVDFLRYFEREDFSVAPPFDFAPQGESLRKEGGHIATRFFQLIQFVENFGMDFEDWAAKLSLPPAARTDRIYVTACEIFYQYYLQYLNSNGYTSFNSIFLSVQPSKVDAVQRKDPNALKKLTHVLIDEFQDITPLYSDFVKAIKLALAQQTGQAGSIMAVGDDYQSIYGWKGSLVKIITSFQEEFRSYSSPSFIKMEINHRCSQNIIQFAEALIQRIPPTSRTSKVGISSKPQKRHPLPRIFFVKRSSLLEQVVALIRIELEVAEATPELPLLVLCIARATVKDLENQFTKRDLGRMKIMTFHASKGLEGKSVILIGDCYYDTCHLIKNDVLRQFNTSNKDCLSYDEAQELEALRLAYVAATRAAVRCHWIFVDHPTISEVRAVIQESAEGIKPLCELVKTSEKDTLKPINHSVGIPS